MRTRLALVAAAAALLLAAPCAGAATFGVDSFGNGDDVAPNGVCDAAPGPAAACTLRAAIEEANATSGRDTITFSADFDGEPRDEIELLPGGLDPISAPLTIDAGDCGAGSPRPCAGLEAFGQDALVVEADGVVLRGLAVYDAATALTASANALGVTNTWLGIDLAGSADASTANATGVALEGADGALFGGTSPVARNVIANNTETGLRIASGDNNLVQGNWFGLLPDGLTAAPNGSGPDGENIEVVDVGGSPTGNSIGATVTGSLQFSPACDGGCNVISASPGVGIDLGGDGGGESAAGQTAVRGNFIGLGPAGDAALPNGAGGVEVGAARSVTIGGGLFGDGNRFYANGAAGGADVDASQPGAGGLLVRGNAFGLASHGGGPAAGAAALAPAATLRGDPDAAPIFSHNRVAADPAAAAALVVAGDRARVTRNVFGVGAGGEDLSAGRVGISVVDAGALLIDTNVVANASLTGILLAGAGPVSYVQGNWIGTDREQRTGLGNGTGILVTRGTGPSLGVVIGGTAPWEENAIAASSGDALTVSGDGNDSIQVLRNTGWGNGGLFLDLEPHPGWGTSPNGPNAGLQPPAIAAAATTEHVEGSGEPGALVHLYRTAPGEDLGPPPGQVDGFVARAPVDAGGRWAVDCPSPVCSAPIQRGQRLVANQTDPAGNASEFSPARTYADVTEPRTRIVARPQRQLRRGFARFRFAADETASFQCRLGGSPWRACSSPKTYARLAPRRYAFRVRAIDRSGNVDRTPEVWRFRVLRRR